MGNATTAAAGQSDLLKIEQKGAVLTVGLNRPAKRNALNDGIILAIQDCFSNLPEGTGAVVIHGVGDHFSSGLDLSELTEHGASEGLRVSQRVWRAVAVWQRECITDRGGGTRGPAALLDVSAGVRPHPV